MKNENEWELLGSVAVDSGQLLLTDPCYLSKWEQREFEDIRIYEHIETGERLQYGVDFGRFDDPVKGTNLSMNDLNETGEWKLLPPPPAEGFSYNSVSQTTLNTQRGGQIGLSVAFSTGYGDGMYPVKVRRNEEGRIMQVLIDFE